MMKRLACALTLAAAVHAIPSDAEACGGCFVDASSENTVVTGHRMAMSISKAQSVLWDQIAYAGDPAEFSWVLPVKPGAKLELAHDAFFQVLDAGTSSTVRLAGFQCQPNWGGDDGYYGQDGYYGDDGYYGGGDNFGCGCSGDQATSADDGGNNFGSTGSGGNLGGGGASGYDEPPPDVQVLNEATVGPYETVTLSTDVPGVLNSWLVEHGYSVPAEIEPVIDAYVAEGFDFIALRLIPDVGVAQMAPVRIVMPGPSLTLPLRMVAAGTGAQTALSLFIIAEGRYHTANFNNALVDPAKITWDFNTSSSNYAELRLAYLGENEGRSWLTPFAKQGVFFTPLPDPYDNGDAFITYGGEGWEARTLAEAYVRQASGNMNEACTEQMNAAASLEGVVVENCDEKGGNCGSVPKGQIPADALRCDGIDDIAVAFTGQYLQDVWLTRIDALLPRDALGTDLILTAANEQVTVENRLTPNVSAEDACASVGGVPAALFSSKALMKPARRLPGGLVALSLALLGAAALFRRRQRPLGNS